MFEFSSSDDELGKLALNWTGSYNGQKAYFVDKNVLMYSCGNTIKFYQIDKKVQTTFKPTNFNNITNSSENDDSNTISLLTANAGNNVFAFSDTQVPPRVFIYEFGEKLKETSTLNDGASVEYLSIEFSNSDVILTLSGVPDMKLIVWNWKDGNKITSISLNPSLMIPKHVCFSPTNWRHIIVAYEKEINLWSLELCDIKRVKTVNKRFLLPPTDQNIIEELVGPEFKDEFKLPIDAITAMNDDSFTEVLDEILDKRERHKFRTLTWSNVDEFLVSTSENHIFKYSINDSTIKCVFKPSNEESDQVNNLLQIKKDNFINGMYLHRQGLFTIFNDGSIKILDGIDLLSINTHKKYENQNVNILKCIDTNTNFISNLSFNKDYSIASISTNRGIILANCSKLLNSEEAILKLDNDKNKNTLELFIDYDYGSTVALASLNPNNEHFLVLKECGSIQLWNIKGSQMINRFIMNENCSYLISHPNIPLVVVGTNSGNLIFIDYSVASSPRIIENCAVHKGKIIMLKFNSTGKLLFSLGADNRLFLIDTRLESSVEAVIFNLNQNLLTNFPRLNKFQPGFYVLGFVEIEGEGVCLDTFDYLGESSKGTPERTIRVAVGLHDINSWDSFKKTIQEMPIFLNNTDPQNKTVTSQTSSVNSSNSIHNLLIQNLQSQSIIPRLRYANSESSALNFDHNSFHHEAKLASKVLIFDFNFAIYEDKARVYASKLLDFKDETINKFTYNTQYLFSDFSLTSRSNLSLFTDGFLVKLQIPEQDLTKKGNKVTTLELVDLIGTHDFGYGIMNKTSNNQFLLTGGFDGALSVRKTNNLKAFIQTRGPHYNIGGIKLASFIDDNLSIAAVGNDGLVYLFNWICTIESTLKLLKQPVIESKTNSIEIKELNQGQRSTTLTNKLTWFEMKEQEFFNEQDAQYLPIKKEILNNILEIKKNLNELMRTNNEREPLAKLQEHEFYLDLEELERLHKESDLEIAKIRDNTEFDNLGKLYIRENIKKECWDSMKVRGRGIQAFNSNLLVENYAIKERDRDELELLEKVKLIRRIEIFAQKTRHELTYDIMKKENIGELAELEEDENKENENQSNQPNYLAPNLAQLSFKGSIGPLFNGDSTLFYNQFELYTREQKWLQIALIQDVIHRIKENFNKEFEQVIQRKNLEIGKIKEKNQRLKQIYIDLNEDKPLSEPQFGDAENPEQLFEVKDDEIKVEKYLTAEQRKQLEEQLSEEARRRELEKMDNWRERGLMDMMGGVLQVRREDELKKDIPIPSFAVEKPQEEWTPEEVKQYQIYEQKVKELNEEREKLKKQLLAEIGKINEQIQDCYQNFDNQLVILHQRKVKTQQAIYQEELKISRLFNSMVVDTELENYENQNNLKLEKLKEQKKELTQEIQQIKKFIESHREEYEILLAEDKSQDKAFLREFSDVSSSARDALLKLFKKRARQRVQLNKTNLNPVPTFIPELGAENPYSDRPSTHQQISVFDADNETALAELDNFDNAPSGVDISVWDRFINFRRQKIAMENQLRMKNLNLTEINLYLQKRMEEDDHKRREIEEFSKNTLTIQELRLRATHNLQIQLLMKQGQVEIDPGIGVHNYENCLLINRNVVESLNKVIKTHGKQKISIMVDCKDFRKGIRQLEWEHKKMKMTIEDYIQKQRDITYLKVSREIQEFLVAVDYDGKKQKEISILEQTIAFKKQEYEKAYDYKNKKLNELKNQSIKFANSNDQIDDELREKNISLHDHKHINDELIGRGKEALRNEKFQQIIQRRKLVDLAKAQAQEVAFLRSEVERLRMKTFPALVQVDY